MQTAQLKPSKYFYPRPPRGGRLKISAMSYLESGISIHALREEGDSGSIVVPP